MDLSETLKEASENPKIKEKKGFYVSSVIAFPKNFDELGPWTLVYYNPKTKKVFSYKEGVVGDESDPLVNQHYEEFVMKDFVDPAELLKKLGEKTNENGLQAHKIILALRDDKWQFAVFSMNLKVLSMDFNAISGEQTRFDITELLQNDGV